MRRRLVLLFVLLLALAGTAQAWSYLAEEPITVAATAIGFTDATISVGAGHPSATVATCRLETAAIRYRIDGTAPTTTVGLLVNPLESFTVVGNDAMRAFLAIRTTGTSGALTCLYSTP